MSIELTMLAWGCVLALAHIFIAVRFKTRQYGTKWNMGARDEALPSPEPIVGRLARAQANFFETFPIAAAAILIAVGQARNELTVAVTRHTHLGINGTIDRVVVEHVDIESYARAR